MTAIEHTTFRIDRTFPASRSRVFRFWSEPDLKRQWTDCHPDWTEVEDVFDFRVGGREVKRWRTPDGIEQTFGATYLDIVGPERILYAFEMSAGGKRVSVSLATIVFTAEGAMTRMAYTEQIAFFAGPEALSARISCTGEGFDRITKILATGAVTSPAGRAGSRRPPPRRGPASAPPRA